MRSRLWLVLVLLVLLVPQNAFATELETRNEIEREEIALGDTRAVSTPIGEIRRWFTNVRFLMTGSGTYRRLDTLHDAIRWFFTYSQFANLFFKPAIIIVFFWWGVRKAIRMLLRAFRKGKIND